MTWLVLAVVYLLVAWVCNAIVLRLPLSGNFTVKFVVCGAVFWLALAVHELLAVGPGLEAIAALLLFAFCWELNIFLFAGISRSVSVGLLMRLRQESLSYTEIQRRYSTAYMVDDRIARLVEDGYLTRTEQAYVMTPRAHSLVATFSKLVRFFGHPEPAFGGSPPSSRVPVDEPSTGRRDASPLPAERISRRRRS